MKSPAPFLTSYPPCFKHFPVILPADSTVQAKLLLSSVTHSYAFLILTYIIITHLVQFNRYTNANYMELHSLRTGICPPVMMQCLDRDAVCHQLHLNMLYWIWHVRNQ